MAMIEQKEQIKEVIVKKFLVNSKEMNLYEKTAYMDGITDILDAISRKNPLLRYEIFNLLTLIDEEIKNL